MTDESESHDFSPSEITAMRCAYRQLLGEHPERFRDIKAKHELAKSVIESLEGIRSAPAKDVADIVILITEDEE